MTTPATPPSVEQINLSYDQTQDRLLFRLRWTDQSVSDFWFTRRLVRSLLPALLKLLGTNPMAVDEASRRELLAYEHQRTVATAEFRKAFNHEGRAVFPDGPLLVNVVKLHTLKNNRGWRVELGGADGRSGSFDVDKATLHSMIKLFSDVLPRTEWELQVEVQGTIDSTGQVIH